MALQSELEPGLGPEFDVDAVRDAGVREGSIVRKMSLQEQLMAQAEQERRLPSSLQDAMLQQTEQQTPYRTGTGSEDTDRYAAGVFGAVESIRTGEDPFEPIQRYLDDISNSPTAPQDIYQKVQQDTHEELRSSLEAAGFATADTDRLMKVYEQLKKWQMTVASPWGFEAYAELMLNGLTALNAAAGRKIVQENIYQNYGMSIVAKEWEGKHWIGDKGWDFAKLLILPGTTIAMSNFAEKFNPGTFGTIRNALGEAIGRIPGLSLTGSGFKAYQKTLVEFWDMPVEHRLLTLPAIHEHLKEIAGGNTFVYMAMIQPFIERAAVQDVNFDYHMDTTTLLGLVPGKQLYSVVKFAKAAANYRKPIAILIKTGNIEKAAALINRALKDATDRARQVTGVTREEAAWSAYPLDVSHLVPGQLQGAAAEAAKQLEDEILRGQDIVNRAYQSITDPSQTPLRFYFEESAKRARQRQVLDDLNDYPNFARIVEHTDDGFVVEVERGSKYAGTYDADQLKAANAVLQQHVEDTIESLESVRRGLLQQFALDEAKLANAEQNIRYAPKARKIKKRTPEELDRAADEAFASDAEANRLRTQLASYKEQIKRNEKIIKDLEKPPKVERVQVKYTFNESGVNDAEELGFGTLPKFASPSQVVDQLLKGTTDKATLAEFIESKILNRLYETNQQLIRGLSRKELKDIDKLLLHGDEMQRVFSIQELIGGVDTRFGLVKLRSSKAIAAYAGMRRNFDEIHRIKNYIMTRELEVGGFKQLKTKIMNSQGLPVKLFAKQSAVRKSIPESVKRIYDHKTGNIVDVDTLDDLQKRFEGDWEVVQFRHGQRFGDEIINYGLVRFDKDLKPISGQVLDYSPGYVPRQRPGVMYVVPKKIKRKVDGVDTEAYQTVRFFSTEREAYEWRAGQRDPDLLPPVPDKRYKSTAYETFDDEWDALNFGGLYTGERTDRTILMGIDGKEAQRTSAYKALSLYMGHIANRYSTNELKMNLIGRFQATYGKYLTEPFNWKSPLKSEYHNDLSLRKAVEAQRQYIEDLIRLPDTFQKWWADKMRSLAEAMEGTILEGKPREWVMNFASRDPTAFLRATSFHMYLGMFNPAQLLVQGMGFATALAAYPHKAYKLLPQNIALRAAWAGRHNPEAIRKVAAAVGIDGDWLVDVVEEINKIGLFDSLKTSADYNASINGISPTADALRRMADSGLFFFREGEQWARGYGYLLARDLFMKGKPKHYKLTQKDIDAIAADSLRFTLNLNRSNRAWWQKGLLSIPTQFWQVMTKFVENLVAGSFGYGVRRWTPAEKVRIMAGYLGMFGMAGIPFMDSLVNAAVEAKRQATDDPQAMTNDRINIFNGVAGIDDETFARLIRGGIIQSIGHWLTGADTELSTRFSIPAGVQESWEMYAHGDRDLADALKGAALPGLMRWWDAFQAQLEIFGPLNWDQVSPEQFRQAAMEFAKIFSTTRNAEKADWWHRMNAVTDSKGRPLMDKANMTDEEFDAIKLWQALGFGPAKVGWMYDLEKKTLGPLQERVSGRVDTMVRIWSRFAPDTDPLDSQQKRAALNVYFGVATEGLTEEERREFFRLFINRVNGKDKSKMTEIIEKAIGATAEAGGVSTSGALANPLMP